MKNVSLHMFDTWTTGNLIL